MQGRGEPCFGTSHLDRYQIKFQCFLNVPHPDVLQKDSIVATRSQGPYTDRVSGQLHFFVYGGRFVIKVLPEEFTFIQARIPKRPSFRSRMGNLLSSTSQKVGEKW